MSLVNTTVSIHMHQCTLTELSYLGNMPTRIDGLVDSDNLCG